MLVPRRTQPSRVRAAELASSLLRGSGSLVGEAGEKPEPHGVHEANLVLLSGLLHEGLHEAGEPLRHVRRLHAEVVFRRGELGGTLVDRIREPVECRHKAQRDHVDLAGVKGRQVLASRGRDRPIGHPSQKAEERLGLRHRCGEKHKGPRVGVLLGAAPEHNLVLALPLGEVHDVARQAALLEETNKGLKCGAGTRGRPKLTGLDDTSLADRVHQLATGDLVKDLGEKVRQIHGGKGSLRGHLAGGYTRECYDSYSNLIKKRQFLPSNFFISYPKANSDL